MGSSSKLLGIEMGHRSTDLLRTRYLNLPQVAEAMRFWVTGKCLV